MPTNFGARERVYRRRKDHLWGFWSRGILGKLLEKLTRLPRSLAREHGEQFTSKG